MKKIIFFAIVIIITGNVFAQNVGIGTAAPTDKLSVVNAQPGYGITHTYGPVTMGTYISNLYGQFGTKSNHPLQFFTNNGAAQLTLLQNGDFGIGTSTPQTSLQVDPHGAGSISVGTNRAAGGYTNIEMGISAQSNGYGYVQATKTSGSSYGNISLNPNGGNTGIGTTAPTSTLDVHGGISLPIKAITFDYVIQNGDYTIAVNMQHDTSKQVNIYLPQTSVNNGRIIKIVAINMDIQPYYSATSNNIKVYNVNGDTLYATLTRWSVVSGQGSHTYFVEDFKTAATFQCLSTVGWIVTDEISHYYQAEYDN